PFRLHVSPLQLRFSISLGFQMRSLRRAEHALVAVRAVLLTAAAVPAAALNSRTDLSTKHALRSQTDLLYSAELDSGSDGSLERSRVDMDSRVSSGLRAR
ncbi:unnamed protein product, partial [Prorocentrum cordatum]